MDERTLTIIRETNESRYFALDTVINRTKANRKLECVFEGRLFSIQQAEALLATFEPVSLIG